MKCKYCNTTKNLTTLENEYGYVCDNCKHKTIVYKSKRYSYDDTELKYCSSCENKKHPDQLTLDSDGDNRYICKHCLLRSGKKICTSCWKFHSWGSCIKLIDVKRIKSRTNGRRTIWGENTHHNWQASGRIINGTTAEMTPLKEAPLEKVIWTYLKSFYQSNFSFPKYNKPNIDIDIKWEISFNDITKLSEIEDAIISSIWNDRTRKSNWLTFKKYSSMYYNGITDWNKVNRKAIDLKWNIKNTKEWINKVLKAYWLPPVKDILTSNYTFQLSNSIRFKFAAFKYNEKIDTCQKARNRDWYAKGGYDFITNGGYLALLITQWQTIKWRILVRQMESKGKVYYILDRLYWGFSSATEQALVYIEIVKALKKKWMTIGVTNYSAHQKSVLQFVKAEWHDSIGKVHNLYQSPRKIYGELSHWYYSDWWVHIYRYWANNDNLAQDYLKTVYLI